MATITCKMCGANLPLTEGASVVECEFCGVKQTVPSADNEKKLALFGRANRLRFSCEFDKAAGVYESIVAEFPTEAEAYWGLVLCKYGIEYVDDPATGKKIPTCHRSSFDSVMDDGDFEQVMENADPIARSVYREEAKQIEELRKGILEVSGKEEPYDIFICYKETAENGDRTLDSVIAQDVYDALTEKGYRVFFSRVTLEDKLGQEYEPYIFAALNSAKVMLAFGTDYEYYNAVWVKNEWSRFLQLIAKGEKKTLIPCYKGLDAYDMPKEFAKLQAQDMGKVGAMQDLLRGIEKLLPKKETVKETVVVQQTSAPQSATVDSLLKRVWMYLEDGEWDNATDYCNRILDIDPENAEPYVGLLMAELHVKEEKDLGTGDTDLLEFNHFNKALRFASSERKAVLEQYQERTIAHAEEKKRIYEENCAKLAAKRNEQASRFISAGYNFTAGLKTDGTVIVTGPSYLDFTTLSDWRDIIAVSCGSFHAVGLRSSGTVATVGHRDKGQCNVFGWRNIVAVSCSHNCTVGLKADGTVVATGDNDDGQCNVFDWQDIVAISCGGQHTVGLKADGSVVAVGYSNWFDVTDWRGIVAISCGSNHTVGLKSDGSVVATGYNKSGQCNVSDWDDIIAISCGNSYTVGLKSDGTVVATGENDKYQCKVSDWRDIIAIFCGDAHTVGLKADGTVVAAGNNESNQCKISNWKLFNDFANIEEEQKTQMERRRMEDEEQAQRAERRRIEKQQRERRANGLCPYCGGEFKGVFSKKCSVCGKPKDY